MTNKSEQGFGVGALVVIIALVLIIGGYMYYSNQDTVPADSMETTPESAEVMTESTVPAGQMEDGSAAPVTPEVAIPAVQ